MKKINNIWELKAVAKANLEEHAYEYLTGAADDKRTFERNMDAFQQFQIRPRRLVDVRQVDTSTKFFDEKFASPIILAPVGMQRLFHPDAEIATVKAAEKQGHLMMTSTVSSCSYSEIRNAVEPAPWFQLYTTSNLAITKRLLQTASENGCSTVVLTVDVPVAGNREKHLNLLTGTMRSQNMLGNFTDGGADFDPGLTWEFIRWFRTHFDMRILIKGIMTGEDAQLALDHTVDGIIVSNHGGRQLESDLGTVEVLEEVTNVIQKKIPVLFDGGVRRGTDVFKALALGADGVCIGRAGIYGLAAGGQAGVERALEILQTELERNMRLAGVTSVDQINQNFIRKRTF